jgi:hypothetical protein
MDEHSIQIQELRKQVSDYAMAFDLLKKVADSKTKKKSIEQILDIFHVLFSPKEVRFLSFQQDQKQIFSTLRSKSDTARATNRLLNYNDPYAWTDSGNGFYVKICYNKKELGVLEVIDLTLPEQKEHYLNLTLSMIDVCGLAIENAARYEKLKDAQILIRKEKRKLEKALSQVKKLSGLLPICGHCKKIRDDRGYWNQIDSYIQENSEAVFSHGICEDCAKKYYPSLDLYNDE